MSQQGRLDSGAEASADSITGNVGGPVPFDSGGDINIVGGGGVTVTGNPATFTLTITGSGASAETLTCDSGIATSSASNINLIGDATQGLSSSGATDTVTLTIADATDSQKGVVELATDAQAVSASSTSVALVPSNLDPIFASPPIIGATAPSSATFTLLDVDNLNVNGNTLSSTDTNGNINLDPDGSGVVTTGVNGFNINPGSDIDATVISVSVTGTPSMVWNETAQGFIINSGVVIGSSDGDLTHTINGATVSADLEIHSQDASDLGGITLHRHSATASFGGHIINLRSDGTHDTPTIVNDGDTLGRYIGAGFNGTDYSLSSEIRLEIDGTPGNNDMPGRIIMVTSPDGSETPTEGFRLDSSQQVSLAGYTTNILNYTAAAGLQTEIGPLTNGQLIIGATGGAPSGASITSSSGSIAITNGSNSINLEMSNYVGLTTFTPVLEFGGASTGITYSNQTGFYTRIDDLVNIHIFIGLTNKGSATGTAQITGLPLTASTLSTFPIVALNTTIAGNGPCVQSATGAFNIYHQSSGASLTQLTNTEFANNSQIRIEAVYTTV